MLPAGSNSRTNTITKKFCRCFVATADPFRFAVWEGCLAGGCGSNNGGSWRAFGKRGGLARYAAYSKIGISFASTSSTIASGTLSSFLAPRPAKSKTRG